MEIPLRASVVFFFLWALTRGLGKRELSQMSAFELLLLVTVGDLVQQGVTQEDYSVTGAMLAAGTIGFWVLVFAYVSYKLVPARSLVEGVPIVIIRDGRPVDEALRVERLTLDEVKEEAREQGIADLSRVSIGVLEPGGSFSFLTRSGDRHHPDGRPGT